jgi:hypothetical protein
MSSPVQGLGENDSRRQRYADHEEGIGASPRPPARSELRAGRRDDRAGSRLQVGGSISLDPRGHEARLHAAEKDGVFGQRLGQLGSRAAALGSPIGELLQPIGALLENCIARRHFFTGGCSPVATRQMREATVRAAIVASAPSPA